MAVSRQSNRIHAPVRAATALAAAALLGVVPWRPADAAQPEQWAKGRVIVETRAGLSDAEVTKILGPHGGQAKRMGRSNLLVVHLPANASETAVKAQLAHHPHLKFAELDRRVELGFVPNDPYLGSQWHLSKVGAPSAWDLSLGSGVKIAILDTGVDGAHPDLASQMVPGWNAYDNNSNSGDVHGHGTAVAGTAAAALNNGTGVASLAGGARIMPIRVTDTTGYAYWSTVAQGLTWAADQGARVANVSFVGVAGSSSVQSAAQYMKNKGGLVIVCAGNNGVDEGIAPTSTLIPVSATDGNDQKTSWSSYGNFVAMGAPGSGIWTTSRGGGYQAWNGTSFSSPVTAGVVALMMAANPALPSSQVESLLYSTAVDLGAAGRDAYYGHGRVDASAAVAAAKTAVASDTQAPFASITAPLASTTVTGLVPVNADASDNVGVIRVELRVNGALVSTDTGSPYQFSWDSSQLANGMASLVATAFDAAGNSKASTTVSVNVANNVVPDTSPPSVAISNPASGAKVSGTVSVKTTASDNAGAAGIKQSLYLNGKLVASATGASLSYNWNTRKSSNGSHTLQAVAKDAAGNTTSTSVSVTK